MILDIPNHLPMIQNIEDYDTFLIHLQEKIEKHLDQRYRIILDTTRITACPYLRSKIQAYERKFNA